jgi:HEAT repeats
VPDDLRPVVAEILRSQHRVGPQTIRALGGGDAAELVAIARGTTHPEFRVKAMSALAEADSPEAASMFREALLDRAADETVRAAGATWLSRGRTPDAEASLIEALGVEPTPVVRHKIVAGLARVGRAASLEALSAVLEPGDPDLAEHARFAQSVVAYRSGVTGYEMPVVPEAERLPAPAAEPIPALAVSAQSDIAQRFTDEVGSDGYGVSLDGRSTLLGCERREFVVGVDASLRGDLAGALSRPMIAGVIGLRAESDGSIHTSMLIMSTPAAASRVHLSVNRVTGRGMYFGTGEIDGEQVRFSLDALPAPGARETTVRGRLVDGLLQDVEVRRSPLPRRSPLGGASERLQPIPVEL